MTRLISFFVSIFCWWSPVITDERVIWRTCPQTVEICNACDFSSAGAKTSLPVCGQVREDSLRCSCFFTLLPMVVEQRAVRMSGRSSSLQPLLSKSLALDLYLACSRKTTRQHTHTWHATDEKPSWCSAPSKRLEIPATLQKPLWAVIHCKDVSLTARGTSGSWALKTEILMLFRQPVLDK